MEAAIDRMPYEEKAAYLEAKDAASEVVAHESEARRFLACEDGNVDKAAHRLVLYWKYRKELFGDRAFKPMLQTGTGALSDDDIEILLTGAAAILPLDLNGRPVFYLDRDRLTLDQIQNAMARSRCFFYLLHLGCMNDAAQTKGIVCLASIANKRNAPVSDPIFNKYGANFARVLPMKVAYTHLLALSSNFAMKLLMDGLMAAAVKMASLYAGHPIVSHQGASDEEVFEKLHWYRLPKRCVPNEYGGSWTHERFMQWHRKQRKIETKKYMTEEEILDRKRKVNLVHSRQKRFRRKIEREVLDDRAGAIKAINEDLETKNTVLESLLIAAKEIVREHEGHQLLRAQASVASAHELYRLRESSASLGIQARTEPPLHTLSTYLNTAQQINALEALQQHRQLLMSTALGPATGYAVAAYSMHDPTLRSHVNDQLRLDLLLQSTASANARGYQAPAFTGALHLGHGLDPRIISQMEEVRQWYAPHDAASNQTRNKRSP